MNIKLWVAIFDFIALLYNLIKMRLEMENYNITTTIYYGFTSLYLVMTLIAVTYL